MDVDEEYMKQAVELYKKEGMGAVRKAFPKCQHTMTIARYRKALEGTACHRAHFRFLKTKIKAYLIEKRATGLKINRELAEKAYDEIKDSCINGDRLKVCPRLLNKLVREVLAETPDEDLTVEEVDWVDVNDFLEDDGTTSEQNLEKDSLTDFSIANVLQKDLQVISIDGHPLIPEQDVVTINNPEVTVINTPLTQPGLLVPTFESKLFNVPLLKWSKVLLIGDSLTQLGFNPDTNWASLLSNKLVRIADVINRGFVGYNTRWYKSIIKNVISEWPPNTVSCIILSFGMIDSAGPDCPTRQHVPYNEFKSNLNDIIKAINSHGIPSSRIIMLGPSYFDKLQFRGHRKEMKNASQLKRKGSETLIYNKGVNQVCKSHGIEFLDLYKITKEKKNEGPLCDGFHLSNFGSNLLFKNLEPMVVKKIQLYNHDNELNLVGESWKEYAKRTPKPTKKIQKSSVDDADENE